MTGPAPTEFTTPFGTFQLQRYPTRKQEPLQAWCAADTLLLEEVDRLGADGARCLVANDEHGALCVPLLPAALWTDSAMAALALQHNLASNNRPAIPLVWSIATPPGPVELVLLRIPKQLSYLEYQLSSLAKLISPGGTLLTAGMDKHLSPHTAELLERYIGPTKRHPGRRKARLFSARRSASPALEAPADAKYYCEELGVELCSGPNVFSSDQLDIGSRFLVDRLDQLAPVESAVDLACGNGVLGLAAFAGGLCRQVAFCDESAMAVDSARANAACLFPEANFTFHHGDGLAGYPGGPADLILCNPPFHLQHVVDDFAGRRLLQQAAKNLRKGGHLCLVANRHLDYASTLRRDFRNVRVMARNSKFNLWLCES